MSFYNNVWCGQCNIIDHALAKRSKSLASLNKLYGELYCRRLLKHSERYQVTQCFLSERSSDHDEVHPAKSSNGLCSQHLCQVNFLEWMADWAKVLLAHHNENSLLRSFSPNFLISRLARHPLRAASFLGDTAQGGSSGQVEDFSCRLSLRQCSPIDFELDEKFKGYFDNLYTVHGRQSLRRSWLLWRIRGRASHPPKIWRKSLTGEAPSFKDLKTINFQPIWCHRLQSWMEDRQHQLGNEPFLHQNLQ